MIQPFLFTVVAMGLQAQEPLSVSQDPPAIHRVIEVEKSPIKWLTGASVATKPPELCILPATITHLSFCNKGMDLIAGDEHGKVRMIDVSTGAIKWTIQSPACPVEYAVFSSAGSLVFSLSRDGQAAIQLTNGSIQKEAILFNRRNITQVEYDHARNDVKCVTCTLIPDTSRLVWHLSVYSVSLEDLRTTEIYSRLRAFEPRLEVSKNELSFWRYLDRPNDRNLFGRVRSAMVTKPLDFPDSAFSFQAGEPVYDGYGILDIAPDGTTLGRLYDNDPGEHGALPDYLWIQKTGKRTELKRYDDGNEFFFLHGVLDQSRNICILDLAEVSKTNPPERRISIVDLSSQRELQRVVCGQPEWVPSKPFSYSIHQGLVAVADGDKILLVAVPANGEQSSARSSALSEHTAEEDTSPVFSVNALATVKELAFDCDFISLIKRPGEFSNTHEWIGERVCGTIKKGDQEKQGTHIARISVSDDHISSIHVSSDHSDMLGVPDKEFLRIYDAILSKLLSGESLVQARDWVRMNFDLKKETRIANAELAVESSAFGNSKSFTITASNKVAGNVPATFQVEPKNAIEILRKNYSSFGNDRSEGRPMFHAWVAGAPFGTSGKERTRGEHELHLFAWGDQDDARVSGIVNYSRFSNDSGMPPPMVDEEELMAKYDVLLSIVLSGKSLERAREWVRSHCGRHLAAAEIDGVSIRISNALMGLFEMMFAPKNAFPSAIERLLRRNDRQTTRFELSPALSVNSKIERTIPGEWLNDFQVTFEDNDDGDVILLSLPRATLEDEDLRRLMGLSELRSLDLMDSGISDEDLVYLKALRRLQVLNLDRDQITDRGLLHLRDMTQLRSLSLYGTWISDSGLEHLKDLPNLKELYLANTDVNGSGLSNLGFATQLQALDLSDTRVTNSELRHLKNFTHLESLYLGGTLISDAGIGHLKKLVALKTLSIRSTQVSDSARAELQKALPNCDVGAP